MYWTVAASVLVVQGAAGLAVLSSLLTSAEAVNFPLSRSTIPYATETLTVVFVWLHLSSDGTAFVYERILPIMSRYNGFSATMNVCLRRYLREVPKVTAPVSKEQAGLLMRALVH